MGALPAASSLLTVASVALREALSRRNTCTPLGATQLLGSVAEYGESDSSG